jgi:hypothetical protein
MHAILQSKIAITVFSRIAGQARAFLQHLPIAGTFVSVGHLSGGHSDPLGAKL